MQPAEPIVFVPLSPKDFPFVVSVYNQYIRNTTVTFRTQLLREEDIPGVLPVEHHRYQSFIIRQGGQAVGFCALSQFRNKEAYDRTAEALVYLLPDHTGKGLGEAALRYLEGLAPQKHIKVLMGYITAENKPSVRLFEKLGYKQTAYYPRIGEKFGRILDVVVYQKELP